MIRNTVVCVIAVLALGTGVLCSATTFVATSPNVTSNSPARTSPSASIPSPSASVPSSSASVPSSSASVPSSSASVPSPSAPLSSPSASLSSPSTLVMSSSASVVSSSASVMSSSASVVPSSNGVSTSMTVQPSFATRSASSSATQSLSFTTMPSSSVLHSSTPPVTSSAATLISASRTAVMASETVYINDNGKLCLTVVLEADFDISYFTKSGSELKASIPLNGVNTTDATGKCSYSNNTAYVQFKWNEEGRSSPKHTFTMNFERANGTWFVPQIDASFNTTDPRFPNASQSKIDGKFNATSKFGFINSNKSYVCDAKTSLSLSKNITANLKNLVLQPFSKNENPRKDASRCAADQPKSGDDDDDNTVPIAVGAALGGLVLIVLVAYIIGRRRSNKGYEQV